MIKDFFRFDTKLISKYSSALMGIAAIMVIICHSSGYITLPGTLEQKFGYYHTMLGVIGGWAVKIFFFLSSVHLYFSMQKNNDVISFYKKRFSRLLITYFFIAFFGSVLNYFVFDFNIIGFIKDYFLIGYFIEGGSSWFVAAIIPMYLSFPLLFKLRNKTKYFGIISYLVWLTVVVLVTYFNPEYASIIKNFLYGFFAFIFGLEFAPYVFSQKKVSCVPLLLLVLLYFIINFLFDFGGPIIKSLEVLLPVALIVIFAIILSKIPYLFNNIFVFFGKISLETYLLGNVSYFLKKTFIYDFLISIEHTGILYYCVSGVFIMLLALMFSKLINLMKIKSKTKN